MHSRKPLSRQDLIQQQQQSLFVGREQQLQKFRHNLSLPAQNWCFLFNIWGQGGVGKSTLTRQFRKLAEQQGCLSVGIDEGCTSVPDAMGRLAEQLEQQRHKLDKFQERYRVYRQKKQELESDPDAPQGLSAFVGRIWVRAVSALHSSNQQRRIFILELTSLPTVAYSERGQLNQRFEFIPYAVLQRVY